MPLNWYSMSERDALRNVSLEGSPCFLRSPSDSTEKPTAAGQRNVLEDLYIC